MKLPYPDRLLTTEVLENAVQEYLKYNAEPPQQLNIDFDDSAERWVIKFCSQSDRVTTHYCTDARGYQVSKEMACWYSGNDALNIFFSRDPEDVFAGASWSDYMEVPSGATWPIEEINEQNELLEKWSKM